MTLQAVAWWPGGPWPQRQFQEGRQNASGAQKIQRTAWLVFRI